jgi:kumamolisin
MTEAFVPLAHSHRPAKDGAERLAEVAPETSVELTLALRGPDLPHVDDLALHPMSRADLAKAASAAPEDAQRVGEALGRFGFTVEAVSLPTRSMRVRGTAAQAEAAFRTRLSRYASAEAGAFRGREGDLSLPAELDGLVTGVFGLDERPVVRRRSAPLQARGAAGPFGPSDLEARYNFPDGDGAGQQIVIAEFGGGYLANDLALYCQRVGRPQPRVTVTPFGVGVPTTVAEIQALPPDEQNAAQLATLEVSTDVQIVAGLCPAAEIFLYFAPVSQKGVIDLLDALIAGQPADPVAVSISWGFAEDSGQLSAAAVQAIDQKLQQLAMIGVTVCVSAGDDGSGAQMSDGKAHVDFPASSAFTLGVGGTMLADGEEVVWWQDPGRRTPAGGGATGGGVSELFARPAWQAVEVASINPGARAGRVVPDVAALAGDPGYEIMLIDAPFTNGGTSAATPVWAALVARMAQHLPAGKQRRFLTRLLYEASGGTTVGGLGCRPVVSGDNASHPHPGKGYAAGPGFSACAGWGVPDGQALLAALAAV